MAVEDAQKACMAVLCEAVKGALAMRLAFRDGW